MRNLFTILLLIVSILAVGQTNNTTEEIKYWKSIADSNDTVAYRQYLNRYGETGLYYDEAITRIALLKTSGKQVHNKNIECCFYGSPGNGTFAVRFDSNHDKIWFKLNKYDTIRSNLAVSSDFYESQATLALSRGTWEYRKAIQDDKEAISEADRASNGYYTRKEKKRKLQRAEQAKSPEYYKNAWTADEEYEYAPMKSTSVRDVYFKQDKLYEIHYHKQWPSGYTLEKTIYLYDDEYHTNYDWWIEHFRMNNMKHETKSMQGYRYAAFSKDKSTFIMWFEEDCNLDGVIYEKREYKRIPKENLLPKAVNYDFLNE